MRVSHSRNWIIIRMCTADGPTTIVLLVVYCRNRREMIRPHRCCAKLRRQAADCRADGRMLMLQQLFVFLRPTLARVRGRSWRGASKRKTRPRAIQQVYFGEIPGNWIWDQGREKKGGGTC